MPILHIEHQVADFDTWKRNAFDADPIGRAKSGVLRHRISQSTSDPNYVLIDLEFASLPEAEAMHAAHEINGPTFAHAILTTEAVIAALGKT